MAKTTHLGLNIYSRQADDHVLFEDWRMAVAGDETDSNMIKIDSAVYQVSQETAQALTDLLYKMSVMQDRMTTVEEDVNTLDHSVDNTLTLSGKAADAYITGTMINDLRDTSTGLEDRLHVLESAYTSGEMDGENGVSPTVSVQRVPDGHVLTIQDTEKTQTVHVPDGRDGLGIKHIAQTTTSYADNGINVLTITLTDDSIVTFQVKNGAGGSGTGGTSNVMIDSTLTISNAAADALATGERISSLTQRIDAIAGGDVLLQTDQTLIQRDGVLSVNTASSVEQDNTLPVTSAAVYAEVGNINAILATI